MNDHKDRNVTRIIPLGGVGEFGANATIISTPTTCILVDFGMLFPPDARSPGVDYYINDPALLLEQFPNLSAIFITHAHEDHIGGLNFLLEKRDLPIYTGHYTTRIIRNALSYYKVKADIRSVELGVPVVEGDISVTFIGVTHSIVQACALAITTPNGTIIHSGDFKVDPLPEDGYPFQHEVFREFGEKGVDLLIMDSTNATKQGFCPSDFELKPVLEQLIASAPGRVFITTFSSHIPRIRKLFQIARDHGRRVSFLGKSFQKHLMASLDTGYLGTDSHTLIDGEKTPTLPDDKILYVVAGSQAETRSALSSLATAGFRGLRFKAGDRMIFSSKAIPGNERQLMLFASDLEQRGIEVITNRDAHVHNSGHGYQEDQAYLLRLTNPRHVAPIHGEYHHLLAHHNWLRKITSNDQEVLLIEDGDVLTLEKGKVRHGGKVEVGMIPIDGNLNLPLHHEVLKDRKDMMYAGMALIVANSGPRGYSFQAQTHGICLQEKETWAEQLVRELNKLKLEPYLESTDAAEKIFVAARTFLRGQTQGKPLIKLVVDGKLLR